MIGKGPQPDFNSLPKHIPLLEWRCPLQSPAMRSNAWMANRQRDVYLLALWRGLQPLVHYTSERSNHAATHQEGLTSFDSTVTLRRVDRALHCSATAIPLTASSPPGARRRLPTQQPASQMQPTALPTDHLVYYLCSPYPARSRVLPLISSASKRTKSLHLAAALWRICIICDSDATDELVITAFLP